MKVQRNAIVFLIALAAANEARGQCLEFQPGFGAWGVAPQPFSSCTIDAMEAFDDGSGPALYFCGLFDIAGESFTSNIAKWDGAQLSSPPFQTEGFKYLTNGLAPSLYDLEVFDDGSGPELAVSGVFLSVDGIAANGVAKFDGTTWSAMPGLSSSSGLYVVPRFAVYDDGNGLALYAGGGFIDTINGMPADGLARWNGSTWEPVGGGFGRFIQDMEVFDDGSGAGLSLFIVEDERIVRWNGSTFDTIGVASGANPLFVGELQGFDDGNGPALYVGGNFTSIDGVAAKSVAKWDGQNWSAVGNPIDVPNDFVVFDDGGGPALFGAFAWDPLNGPSIAKWTGSAWVGFDGATDTDCEVLHVFDDGQGSALYAGGLFRHADGMRADRIARWKNGAWAPLVTSGGRQGRVDAITAFDDGGGLALYADNGRPGGDSIEKWNGASWTQLGSQSSGDVAALAVYGGQLYAGGEFEFIDGIIVNGITRWNGSNWTSVGGLGAYNSRVLDFAVHDFGAGQELVACGLFQSVGGVNAKRIARWNGTTWSALGDGFSANTNCVAVYDDGNGAKLYAGGGFNFSGATSVSRIARWNGSAWEPVGGGTNARVIDLAVYDDGNGAQLYACGDFTTVGGQAASYIARWDGVAWSALPAGGSSEPLERLAVFDDGSGAKLYVSGPDGFSSPTQGTFLASFDGATWAPLGDGTNGDVNAFGVLDRASGPDSLFLGGTFTRAGDFGSAYIAEWKPSFGCAPQSYCTAGTTTNGCNAHISGSGTPSASASSGFVLDVQDVEGNKTGLIFYGIDGRLAAHWGATTSFLCLKAPTQRTTTNSSGGTNGSCDGSFSLDWNQWIATHPGALGTPFTAGQAVQAQCWFRDPPNPKTTSLSDALEFYVGP